VRRSGYYDETGTHLGAEGTKCRVARVVLGTDNRGIYDGKSNLSSRSIEVQCNRDKTLPKDKVI